MSARHYKATSGGHAGRARLLLLILGVGLASSGCASLRTCGPADPWWAVDKARHFGVSAVLGAGITLAAENHMNQAEAAALGLTTSMAAGLGKEAWDLRIKHTCWSWKDLVWDFLGASAGVAAAAWASD